MKEEGYIKFNCKWIEEDLPDTKFINELNIWRNKLHEQGLIGAYSDGVGFGNISIRTEHNNFLITGTATGNRKYLTEKHYTCVTDYDIARNSITCRGKILASSESMTHAVIYEFLPVVNAVVHIHNNRLWKKLINKIPTTSSTVAYGTPQMASEIERLIEFTDLSKKRLLAMAGHQDGLISMGNDLPEAANKFLLEL